MDVAARVGVKQFYTVDRATRDQASVSPMSACSVSRIVIIGVMGSSGDG